MEQVVILFYISAETLREFPQWLHSFTLSTAVRIESLVPTFSSECVDLFTVSIPTGVGEISEQSSFTFFLMANDVEQNGLN